MYVLPADRWALHQTTEMLSGQKFQFGIRMQIFLPNTSIFIQGGTSIIQRTLHSVLNCARQTSFPKLHPFLHTQTSWLLTWFLKKRTLMACEVYRVPRSSHAIAHEITSAYIIY